jgi:2-amino-4-hydroxy-6-hydroxymethyldihydropteridine diphosphokinase
MKEHEVIISLASNENQEDNLTKAREQLTQLLTELHFTSAIWTEPVYTEHGTWTIGHPSKKYLNQLCKGRTTFGEGLLCEVLKETEKRIGRTRNEDGIVAIDLDLLQFDGQKHHLRDWGRSYVKDLLKQVESL